MGHLPLTFQTGGHAYAAVDTADDLSRVLDDAHLMAEPAAGAGRSAARNGERSSVTGTVPAGQTRTVTYAVEVVPFADQGDHVLVNALALRPRRTRVV